MRRQAGFTLVEVLVALSILALLALMSWRGLDGMLRLQQATQERQASTMGLQIGLAQWLLDLDHLADSREIYPVAWEPASQTLRLLRRTGPAQAEGLLVVAWRWQGAADELPGRWTRQQSEPLRDRQALVQAWQNAVNATPVSSTADLVPLSRWQVQFYRAGAWGPATPPDLTVRPPRPERPLGEWPEAVRAELQLPTGEALAGSVTTDWFNPNTPPPPAAASANTSSNAQANAPTTTAPLAPLAPIAPNTPGRGP